MDNTEIITVLSLCAGYGGLEIGLARALENPLRIVAVEVEAFALANLVAKTEQGKMAIEALWPDLRTFPAEKFRGCFDIITAGFPCQPFSVAGKRKGSTDERHLWPAICRIIKAVKPFRLYLENVPGLLSARILDNRPDFVEYLTALAQEEQTASARNRWYIQQHRKRLTTKWLREEGVAALAGVYFSLRNLGYSVEAGLFTAAEIGAPHRRQRLFILADTTEQGLNEGNVNQEGQVARYCTQNWPARPGQPQYEWEEPRVVGNAQSKQGWNEQENLRDGCRRESGEQLGQASSKTGQTKPQLGRAVNGPSSRVDRLRLLGNGVVPQCAELAFKELSNGLHT